MDRPVAEKLVPRDYSAGCVWRSRKSGSQYVYLFGKKEVVLFMLRTGEVGTLEIVEIQTFQVPIEAEVCAISASGRCSLRGGGCMRSLLGIVYLH